MLKCFEFLINRKLFKAVNFILDMEKQVLDFDVFIEQDEDGIYVARAPEIGGCYTQGKTIQEAVERIKEAIEVCLEDDENSPQQAMNN